MNGGAFGRASVLALVVAAAGVSAQAQTAARPNDLEEVVISARKTEEKLRDVPIAATVLDATTIADQGGVRTMEDLLANAPSVHFLNTTSPTNSEVTIRGSGTSRGSNAEAAVGLYRNGAYVGGGTAGGRTFSRLDLFDVERFEILRGTQGALYGRNAVGGAINVISAKPAFDQSGELFLQYGSKEYKQADLILNYALTENLAVRFSGSLVDQPKGCFYNPTRDEYYDSQDSDTARLQLRYRTDRFDGVLLGEHYRANLQAVTFRIVIPNGSAAAFPGGYIQDPYVYPHNGPGAGKQLINGGQAIWSYRFDGATLSSSSLYRERRTLFAFDGDGVDPVELARIRAANPGSAAATDPNVESITRDQTRNWFQDLHLDGQIGERVRWLAGGEYVKFKSRGDNTTGRTPTAANGQSPGTVAPVALNVRSYAAYGLLGFDLTETLNLTAEARYTADDRSIAISRFDRRTGLPVTPSRFTISGAASPNNFNYTLSAGWKFMPEWLLYAKIGTAFRAGSFNTDLGDPRGTVIPLAYDDEGSTTYELGLKGNVAPSLYLALTGYLTRIEDVLSQRDNGCRATNPQCPVAVTNFLTNAGTAEVRGLELEAFYRTELWGGLLRGNAGITLAEGKFESGPDAGKRIPRIPETKLTANINYRRPLAGAWSGFANLRYNAEYGGNQEVNPDIPIPFTLPNTQFRYAHLRDHTILDVRVGVGTARTELAVYSDNVTDKRYVLFEAPASNRQSTPRRVGVQLRQRF